MASGGFVGYFAYIDPGMGSIILQVIIGAVLGGLVVFRRFFTALFAKIASIFKKKSDSGEDEHDDKT